MPNTPLNTATTLEIRFELKPEELDGGYTRYTSDDLPGFRILCEPNENPISLIESAIYDFIPPLVKAVMRKKVFVKGLRIIPSAGIFRNKPAPIEMKADLAYA